MKSDKKQLKKLSTVHQEVGKFVKCLQHIKYLYKETNKTFNLIAEDELFKQYAEQTDVPTTFSEESRTKLEEVLTYPLCILVLGQTRYAKAVVINELFQRNLVPLTSHQPEVEWRIVRFKYGPKQTLSLVLPEDNYDLGDNLTAYETPSWETIPEKDMQLNGNEKCDSANKAAILDVTLNIPLLHEGARVVMASNCPLDSPTEVEQQLARCTANSLPIFVYAVERDQLNREEKFQLSECYRLIKDPAFLFVRVPEPDIYEGILNRRLQFSGRNRSVNLESSGISSLNLSVLTYSSPSLHHSTSRQNSASPTPNLSTSRQTSASPTPQTPSTSLPTSNDEMRLLSELCSIGFVFTATSSPISSPSLIAKSMTPHNSFLSNGYASKDTPPDSPSAMSSPGVFDISADSKLANSSSMGTDTCQLPINCELVSNVELEFHTRLVAMVRSYVRRLLIQSVTLLYNAQLSTMNAFVTRAYELAYHLMITPKRLEFARGQETKLFYTLLEKTDDKQEEISSLITKILTDLRRTVPEAVMNYDFVGVAIDKPLTSRDYKICTNQIREFVLKRVNSAIAAQLLESIDVLREAYLGTLERCLKSLELSNDENTSGTTDALKSILNTTYGIDVPFKTSSSYVRTLLERMKILLQSLPWQPGPQLDPTWKRNIATEMLESLSDVKISREVCGQISDRLKQSHEEFTTAMRRLEVRVHEKTSRSEEAQDRIRRTYAPRLTRLALESTSIRDAILYGSPVLGREVGRGQYGVVYSCNAAWGPYYPVAIKSVVPPDDKHWNDLALEFYYTKQLPENERIVNLRGSVIDYTYGGGGSPAVLLIMERLVRDLHLAIKQGLDWGARLLVGQDVVEGIRFLHSQGLIHRDIKLKNVLLDSANRGKLTDLGFCKPHAMMSGSVVGTPIHMAPELFSGRYDSSVDVYAFGILFWYICAGKVRLPYNFEQCSNKDMLWSAVKKGVRPERLPQFDPTCWEIMSQCWHNDPQYRPFPGDLGPMLDDIRTQTCSPNSHQPSDSAGGAKGGPVSNGEPRPTHVRNRNRPYAPSPITIADEVHASGIPPMDHFSQGI